MGFLLPLLFAQAVAGAPDRVPVDEMLAIPPSAEVAEEIVVIGRTMEKWKGGVYKQDGELKCRIKISSGDADVDAIRCGAMLRCVAPEVQTMDRIAALDIPRKERSEMLQAHMQSLTPCFDAAHEAGTRFLAERRVGSK